MYCSNCGSSIPEEAAFCPNCGTAVASEDQQKASVQEPQKAYIQKQKKVMPAVAIVLGIIIVIALAVGYQSYNSPKNIIVGTWTVDYSGTKSSAEFEKDGTLIVTDSSTNKGTYSIDIENKKITINAGSGSSGQIFGYAIINHNKFNLYSADKTETITFTRK